MHDTTASHIAELDEEHYCREMLALLHREYLEAAQPWIDRLAALHSVRTPQMVITIDDAKRLGVFK